MRRGVLKAFSSFGIASVTAVVLLAALPVSRALAFDVLGLYLGGAAGRSQVEANAPIPVGDFKANRTGYKVMAGIRPLSLFSAELDYFDLGHSSNNLGGLEADATIKGTAAFGLFYLPIPLVDIYAKVGMARMQSTLNVFNPAQSPGTLFCTTSAPNCNVPTFQQSQSHTGFAGGVGAQFKLGSWGMRGEFERFNTSGGNPTMLSVGLTWTFL
jgi:hypothetical protein